MNLFKNQDHLQYFLIICKLFILSQESIKVILMKMHIMIWIESMKSLMRNFISFMEC